MILVVLLCSLVQSSSSVQSSIAYQAETPKLTFQQRKDLRQWIIDYRRSRSGPDGREDTIKKILGLGPYGAKELLAVVDKQLNARVYSYRSKFQKQASSMLRKRTSPANFADLARLQNEVLALRDVENLSKEVITGKADPAIKELRTRLMFNRESVLDGSSSLQSERQQLAAPGRIWEQCQRALLEKDDRRQPDVTFERRLRSE